MEAISGLNTKVSTRAVVIPLVDRVSSYAARRREELQILKDAESSNDAERIDISSSGSNKGSEMAEAAQEESNKKDDMSEADKADSYPPDRQPSHTDDTKSEGSRSHNIDQAQEAIPEETPNGETSDNRNDTQAQDQTSVDIKDIERAVSGVAIGDVEPLDEHGTNVEQLESTLAVAEKTPNELEIVSSLFGSFWNHVSELIESRPDILLQDAIAICVEDEVAGVMRLCASLISKGASGQKDGTSSESSGTGGVAYLSAADEGSAVTPIDEEDLAEEQGLLARLVHLVRGPDVVTQISLLTVMRDAFSQGGDLVRYTYPAVISGATRLLGPFAAIKPDSKDDRADWLRKVRQLCRFVQVTTSTLVERSSGSPDTAELALQLFLMSAQAAAMSPAFRGEPTLEEAAYEFIVQAFTVYEEHINESRAQFQSLILVINALHASRNFSAENYETLAAKCVQHGSRLLKRPDQTRLAFACAQLWWKTLPDSELIPPPAEPGQDEAEAERVHSERMEFEKRAIEQHNNGDKVLAHLQRSMKVADSCLDPVLSVRLFVELLNQSAIQYERRCLAVTPKYINDLIDLIRTSISNIEAFDKSTPEPTRAAAADAGAADVNALYDPETHMNTYVLGYFNRTLDYIRSRKELAASGEYNLPDFSAIHCDEPENTNIYF
ncbi:retromer complex subunit Vps35 [Coemansia sp. RSA 1285]|nr:retromer complex subunit Vps35 [Coemansia sp. RSA 1285]